MAEQKNECACCRKTAVGFEPRFCYWYCEDHKNTPPVEVSRLRVLKLERKMFKYLVKPGLVISRTDGQRHYVGANDLIRLYGVPPNECVIYKTETWWPYFMVQEYEDRLARMGLIVLAPRYDGDYFIEIPKEKR